MSVHQGPTLTNPNAIDSVAELRTELSHANQQLLRLDQQVIDMKLILQEMAKALNSLVVPYLQGDDAGLQAALRRLVDERVKVVNQVAAAAAGRVQ